MQESVSFIPKLIHVRYGWSIWYRGEVAREVVGTCVDLVDETMSDFSIDREEVKIENKPVSNALFFGERGGEQSIVKLLRFLECLVLISGKKGGSCSIEFHPVYPLTVVIRICEDEFTPSIGEIVVTVPSVAVPFEKAIEGLSRVLSDEG